MKITIDTSAYNERRYGKPWIARISGWSDPNKPEYAWGNWAGRPGERGMLILDAEPGDFVARGQRDNRPTGTRPGVATTYGRVQQDGSIEWYGDLTPMIDVHKDYLGSSPV